MAPRSEDGLPELGSVLPNLDGSSSHQAAADEKDWLLLADDFMQDSVDDLMAGSSQAAASVLSAAPAGESVNLGRTISLNAIQRALHTARLNLRREEDSDQDPNCAVNYDPDSSDEGSPVTAEIQNNFTPVAKIQNDITPAAEIQSNIAPEAAEFQRTPHQWQQSSRETSYLR